MTYFFRNDNTVNYSSEALAALNFALSRALIGVNPDRPDYDSHVKNLAAEVERDYDLWIEALCAEHVAGRAA